MNAEIKILCLIHEEEMREEYADKKWTAICLKCPKRYELCYFVHLWIRA